MDAEQMKERTMQYALRIIRLVRSLPRDVVCREMGRQLLKAGTSVAASYRAACRGRSRAEFVSKLGIVEEEGDESLFWMEVLVRSGIVKEKNLQDLMTEGDEIVAIVVRSKKTARARSGKRQPKPSSSPSD